MSSISQTSHGPATLRTAAPSKDEIQQRAYEIFCARGRTPGDATRDWLEAERELQGKMKPAKASPTVKTSPQPIPATPKDAAVVSATFATKPQAKHAMETKKRT